MVVDVDDDKVIKDFGVKKKVWRIKNSSRWMNDCHIRYSCEKKNNTFS